MKPSGRLKMLRPVNRHIERDTIRRRNASIQHDPCLSEVAVWGGAAHKLIDRWDKCASDAFLFLPLPAVMKHQSVQE